MQADIIILGTGQAGVPLAVRLARAGKRVLIAERAEPGGTCINYGCTPTKTMIASARAAYVARSAARLGVHVGDVRVELGAVRKRKDEMVSQWREGVRKRLSSQGDRILLAHGHARFVGEREVELEGQRHQAPIVIINVGARPMVPPIPGLSSVSWLDNRRVMELQQVPAQLVILGGGDIGCEFGQMFRRFGASVVMVERSPHLLSHEDADVSSVVEEVFRAEGINLHLGQSAQEVSAVAEGVLLRLSSGAEVRGSHLLVAVGRRPNTDDLGCAAAGIALDDRGFVQVDDHYQTSAKGVYAVGDATPQPQFTHTSWDDHRRLFDLLMERRARGRHERLIPYTVFTDPEVAAVGLNEREAQARGIGYELAKMPFGDIARAIELDERAGILKLLVDPKTERILGATIVGAQAGELIHVFVSLMQAGASPRAIADAEFIHPTFAEGLQSLVMRLERFALDSPSPSDTPSDKKISTSSTVA